MIKIAIIMIYKPASLSRLEAAPTILLTDLWERLPAAIKNRNKT